MDGRFTAPPFDGTPPGIALVSPEARVEDGAIVEGPCFIDEGAVVKAGARDRRPTRSSAGSATSRRTRVIDGVDRLGRTRRIGRDAVGRGSRSSAATATSAATPIVDGGVVLGDKSRRHRLQQAVDVSRASRSPPCPRKPVNPAIFKAYDVRGTYPDEINERCARDIGARVRRLPRAPSASRVSRDMRLSSPALGGRVHRRRDARRAPTSSTTA